MAAPRIDNRAAAKCVRPTAARMRVAFVRSASVMTPATESEAVQRIRRRPGAGGHDVPEGTERPGAARRVGARSHAW
jgi:hypothetical protein